MIVWARYDEKGEINYCNFSVPDEEQQEENYVLCNQTWQPKDVFDMLKNQHQIQYIDQAGNVAVFKMIYDEDEDLHKIVIGNIKEIMEQIIQDCNNHIKGRQIFDDLLLDFKLIDKIENLICDIMKQYKQQFDYDYNNGEFLKDSKAQVESRKKIKEMRPYYRTDFDIPDATPDNYMDRLLDRYYDQLPIWH